MLTARKTAFKGWLRIEHTLRLNRLLLAVINPVHDRSHSVIISRNTTDIERIVFAVNRLFIRRIFKHNRRLVKFRVVAHIFLYGNNVSRDVGCRHAEIKRTGFVCAAKIKIF